MQTLPTVKTEDVYDQTTCLWSIDETIRTKQSLLTSRRYYYKAML